MCKLRIATAATCLVGLVSLVSISRCTATETADVADLRAAATKSLTLIEKSTVEYREHRTCFSCHHQTMPILAMAEARRRGFAIDEDHFQKQIQSTVDHLKRGRANYEQGRGQGGKVDTAGYALWALAVGDHKPDATTATVTDFLLTWRKDSDHWRRSGNRPPSEASDFSTSYVAIRGLENFGTTEQAKRIAVRTKGARKWFLETMPKDTEDRVFRLRALGDFDADTAETRAAAEALIEQQRKEGGWSQMDNLESDAYATGTVLVALAEYCGVSVADDVYHRGLKYLLKSQLDDGSWHVKSRSKPFQKYFESGFPHGKDQFISITATCWATLALLKACPKPKK